MLTLLNIFNILNCVRSIWNIIFGTLMIFLQLNWKAMINRNFGFLNHWFLRGAFYIFVGTNSMTWGTGSSGAVTFWDYFSLVAGFACCFVGTVELVFGFKCAPENEGGDAESGINPAQGGAGGPTLSVNLTPNQVAQGANWAANNPGTVAAVANAAGGAAAAAGGGGANNPFFGNAHLGNRK